MKLYGGARAQAELLGVEKIHVSITNTKMYAAAYVVAEGRVIQMKYIVNQKEMQAIDNYSIQKAGIPSLVLMEKAAASVAQSIKPQLGPQDKVLAVAGNGNNGADAAAAARILYNMGFEAEVYFSLCR